MSSFDTMSTNVTHVTVRSGGGNRYIASYFATLKRLGFSVVSSLNHQVPNINYAAVYVFEHKSDEGVSREAYDAAMKAMADKHIATNHSAPYTPSPRCTEEVWFHNQRIDYTNEIRAWPNDC
jgi:hypothetical protein